MTRQADADKFVWSSAHPEHICLRWLPVPDEDSRREVQSKTLEALFEALFRVLKHATASGALMQAASGESRAIACLTANALPWQQSCM